MYCIFKLFIIFNCITNLFDGVTAKKGVTAHEKKYVNMNKHLTESMSNIII